MRVSALQQERWWGCCACVCIGTWTLLTHPTPPVTDHERAAPVSAQQQERWWGCCACVCAGTWTLLSHPTPPHPTGTWMRDDEGAQVSDILGVGAQVRGWPCEGVVFMTWWLIPVLETSRSSRLSVVGYTSRPAHTTEDVQNYADTLDPGRFLRFWLLQTLLYPITYMWELAGFGCSFGLAIAQALRMNVLYFRAFMQAARMRTGLLFNFLWLIPFS